MITSNDTLDLFLVVVDEKEDEFNAAKIYPEFSLQLENQRFTSLKSSGDKTSSSALNHPRTWKSRGYTGRTWTETKRGRW